MRNMNCIKRKRNMELLQLDPNLKSKTSPVAYLYIENGTGRTVDVFWIDYHSKLVRLKTLEPFKGTPINTFSLHPWIFIDHFTGQLLHIKNKPVLYGRSWHMRREKVFVHLPMQSLQEMALLCLLKHLESDNAVDKLEIPQILKFDLRKVFLIYEEHKRRLQGEPQR